jgi:glycosyltransferase involved in cell wall biosynthesis
LSTTLKPLLLSHSDSVGGAARAAYRLHRALVDDGVDSRMRVASKATDDWRVHGPLGKSAKAWEMMRTVAGQWPVRLQRTTNPIPHSPAAVPSRMSTELAASEADVINLHWVCGDMLSIEDIGRISKPVVWTLHDSWAFSGAEHHPDGPEDDRAAKGYEKATRRPGHGGFDLDAWVWRRKRRAWLRPFHVVSPSQWLANCARRSILMRNWPITVIPNPLPIEIYRPWPKLVARSMFGLPTDAPLILFGAIGGAASQGKGWELLAAALNTVASVLPGCHAVVMGQSEPAHPPTLDMPQRYLGHMRDDATLALVYSAADVVVVPSRLENLPQAATEAHACGTPVVAFDCGGVADVVVHGSTGYLARPYSTDDLAAGIIWTLADSRRRGQLGATARQRAESLWSPKAIAGRYLQVYRDAIGQGATSR